MRWALLVACCLVPGTACAQVTQFVFTTAPQTIAPNATSEQITLEAQDVSGQPVSGSTICIRLSSSSSGGQFSTNTSWSDPLSALTLTLSSNQSRRNFYYRDSISGSHTISAQAALRPDGGTCTQWSPEGGVMWWANHAVTISGSTGSVVQTDSQSTTTATQSNSAFVPQSAPVSSYIPPPEPELFADVGSDRVVIVGADVEYIGRAYNRKREAVENARFNWNFGDGATAEGRSVLHHFEYPGRYVVVLSIAENFASASDRLIVTAEPAKLGFLVQPDGSVVVENNSGRDLDLSSWVVRAFMREFVLPDESNVLAGASMRISPKTLGFFAGAEAELAYPNGVLALRANQSSATETLPVAPIARPIQGDAPKQAPTQQRATPQEAKEVEEEEEIGAAPSSVQTAAAANAMAGTSWWFGALGLAILSGAGVVAAKRMRRREWDIIEESQ